MIISVASGKGGTGKTTVAVNLALSIEGSSIYDCDVEEPNVHLMLRPDITDFEDITLPVPVVDQDVCTRCGQCADFCQFNAIFVGRSGVVIYPEICHSCGGCALVCPVKAITEMPRPIGRLYRGNSKGHQIVYGTLNIGEPIATSVIKAVKAAIHPSEIAIIDAPPGTACPVIESVRGSDYIVLVTEPTPFGLYDLSLAVEVMRGLETPFGVIINKAGIGDDSVREYCNERGIPVLLEIPFERTIAELYSRGTPFVEVLPEWRKRFVDLFERIRQEVSSH